MVLYIYLYFLQQNETETTDERTLGMGVHSQPGEPPPVITVIDSPPRLPCVQDVGITSSVSVIANQEQVVPADGVIPCSLSPSKDVKSELVPSESICSTSHVKPLVSMPTSMSLTSSGDTTSNVLDLKRELQQSVVGSEIGSANGDPMQPPKCREDVSGFTIDKKVCDPKDEVSLSQKLVCKQNFVCAVNSAPSHSATSFATSDFKDLSLSKHFTGNSSKKEQLQKIIANNLTHIDLREFSDEIISLPEKLSVGKGKELPGKRKRYLDDEPSSSASDAKDFHGVSNKKKVKSSSLFHDSKDISTNEIFPNSRTSLNAKNDPEGISVNRGDGGSESLPYKPDDHCSRKDDIIQVSDDTDDDNDSLFLKNKAKHSSGRESLNTPDKCDSESKSSLWRQTGERNSPESSSLKDSLDDDSDNEPLFFKRKCKELRGKSDQSLGSSDNSSDSEPHFRRKSHFNPPLIYSSDDDSDTEVPTQDKKTHPRKGVEKKDASSLMNMFVKNPSVALKRLPPSTFKDSAMAASENCLLKVSPSSDCEPHFCRKPGFNPSLISSSDDDSDAEVLTLDKKTYTRKDVEKRNASSLINMCVQIPAVALERLPPSTLKDSGRAASGNCPLKVSHTLGENEKNTGDEIYINDSCRNKSHKYNHKHKRKRKFNEGSNASDEYEEEALQTHASIEQQKYSIMENKSLGKDFPHVVTVNPSRENHRGGTSDPLPSECVSSALSDPCMSAESDQSNKVAETNKVSSEPAYKGAKSNTKETGKNIVEAAEVKVKIEPGVSCEEISNSSGEKAETDEVVFMYSQVGEEIWISSDDETPTPPDPANSSIDEEFDFLFGKEDEQKPATVEVCVSPKEILDVDGSEMDDHGSNADDQWFPVLSQSFLEDSDDGDKVKECSEDSKDASTNITVSEPTPGPSGLSESVPESEEDENDEWWPNLSQGFFEDDEPELEEKDVDVENDVVTSNNSELETEATKESPRTGCGSDLQSIIEKVKKKSPRTSQLTEAKIPLCNTKKSKQRSRTEMEVTKASKQSVSIREKVEPKKKKQKNSTSIMAPVKKLGKNKCPDLRKTLSQKFNLESYKSTLECQNKEKHHLVSKKYGKSDVKKVSERTVYSKSSENMSIQKKTKSVGPISQNKVQPKVAAKVTKKTRFEKLLDYDINLKSSKSVVASKKSSFRIPKTCVKTSGTPSVNHEVQGCGSALSKRSPSVAGSSDEAVSLHTTVSQPQRSLGNAGSEKHALSSSSIDERNNTPGSTTKISQELQRLQLKSKPKKVNFPQKEEDLVKVRLIPSTNKKNIPPGYMELFVSQVCHWNYDWLECYHNGQEKYRAGVLKTIPSPPPVVSSTNYPTLVLYSSYKDYKETHSSLFYLELWERIYRDWIQSKHLSFQALIEFVKPVFSPGGCKFWALKLMVAVPQTYYINFQDFRQGTLISLKVRKDTKKSVIFGYIDHMNRSMVNDPQKFSLEVRVVKEIVQGVKPATVVTISPVSYIRPSSRIWESLCKLPLSPLCEDILSPTLAAFSCERETKYIIQNFPLNKMQEKAVTTVSSKCMYDSRTPKISLIHGPPGTGKTNTVVALVAQMVMMGRERGERNIPHCRVLICAPSNAAVDELTLRLIRLRDIGLDLRVVRVGFKVSDHPLVRNCTLENFVRKQVSKEISAPRCESAKQEWQRRKFLVEQVAEELEKARKEGSHSDIRQLEIRLNEMARAKAEFEKSCISEPSAREKNELQQKWQQEFLLKAEVVATTLNSCVSGIMGEVLSKHQYHFTCCIVDEAGQCQETETLLPLLLGLRKLVLVGDHHQLPATVLSQLALSKNLKQSLFERMHHRLVLELQREDVVHTLNMQYRMHPEIVEWPSYHFYRNKLITSDLASHDSINLKPYIIFDLQVSILLCISTKVKLYCR